MLPLPRPLSSFQQKSWLCWEPWGWEASEDLAGRMSAVLREENWLVLLSAPAQAPLLFPFLITFHLSPVPIPAFKGRGLQLGVHQSLPCNTCLVCLPTVAEGACAVPAPQSALDSHSRMKQHSQGEQPCCSHWREAIFVLPFAERW